MRGCFVVVWFIPTLVIGLSWRGDFNYWFNEGAMTGVIHCHAPHTLIRGKQGGSLRRWPLVFSDKFSRKLYCKPISKPSRAIDRYLPVSVAAHFAARGLSRGTMSCYRNNARDLHVTRCGIDPKWCFNTSNCFTNLLLSDRLLLTLKSLLYF